MRRIGLILLFSLILTGCAGTSFQTPFSSEKAVIQLDYGTFLLTYMDASSAYEVAKYVVSQECVRGVRRKDQCDLLAKIDDRIQLANDSVRKSIVDPRYPVDWQKVQQFLGDILNALVKIGIIGAAP